MDGHGIISSRGWESHGEGARSRIVLRRLPENIVTPFVTHRQIETPDRPMYFVSGHYFLTLREGLEDFKAR